MPKRNSENNFAEKKISPKIIFEEISFLTRLSKEPQKMSQNCGTNPKGLGWGGGAAQKIKSPNFEM